MNNLAGKTIETVEEHWHDFGYSLNSDWEISGKVLEIKFTDGTTFIYRVTPSDNGDGSMSVSSNTFNNLEEATKVEDEEDDDEDEILEEL